MLSSMVSRLVIMLFGTLYPAFASYKAVRTKNIREYVKWMMYWIVFAIFTSMETVTDLLLAWFPFYYEIKILLVVWLLSPATRGSSILYKKFVHPWLERNEAEIERCLERASQQGYSTVMTLGVRGVNYATQMIMQTAIRGGGGLVDHLRRSYSVNDVTDLSTTASSGVDDFNSNSVLKPRLVDVTEEPDSDGDPASAPAEPRPRRARRQRPEPARTRRAAVRAASGGDEHERRPPPPVWQQAQSLEDVSSSGYNSGEPFYDALNRDEAEEAAAWQERRGAPTARSLRRPPLHTPAATGTGAGGGSRRVKSSAQTDVSGYATLPRSSRRAGVRKPLPKYD